mmetsp:Transcript_20251/g.21698  ORF Transcript_20251/g.21698 Transcript_20251/m.21698 type:complete len:391 (-) Transcript_20251:149-1321(-)
MAKKKKYDGNRVQSGSGGNWLSLEEAVEYSIPKEKWWEETDPTDSESIRSIQHDPKSPNGKPVWRFENGDMYLGQWGPTIGGCLVEHGRGITYNHWPPGMRGLICNGEFRGGLITGKAESFWLEDSKNWKNNRFSKSVIRDGDLKKHGKKIPFKYKGKFVNSAKNDEKAVVTLKDGTTRVGPWKDNRPVGDWHSHKKVESSSSESESSTPTPTPTPSSVAVAVAVATSTSKSSARAISKRGNLNEEKETNERCSKKKKKRERKKLSSDKDLNPKSKKARNDNGNNSNNGTNDGICKKGDTKSRIKTIALFLSKEGIGCNPSPATMNRYGDKLFHAGYESVDMIKKYLNKNCIQSFDWMLELHKRILIENLGLQARTATITTKSPPIKSEN